MNEKFAKKVLSDEELMEITGGATFSDDCYNNFLKHKKHKKPHKPIDEPVLKYGIIISKYGVLPEYGIMPVYGVEIP